jgi:hypothetical protein
MLDKNEKTIRNALSRITDKLETGTRRTNSNSNDPSNRIINSKVK